MGQILWVNQASLPLSALVFALILAFWIGLGPRLGRVGFYALFACAMALVAVLAASLERRPRREQASA